MTYSARIIAGGKIVIPAAVRRELGLHDGDMVQIERDGDHVIVKSFAEVIREGQRVFRETIKQPFTVDDYLAERAVDAARE